MLDLFLMCFFANVLSLVFIFLLFTIMIYFRNKKRAKDKNIK